MTSLRRQSGARERISTTATSPARDRERARERARGRAMG